MLFQLSIQNFALIDQLIVELDQKSNVLTGETGAGKSIIIDAVSLLLGARGQTEYIRNPKEKAVVQGIFKLEGRDLIFDEYLNEIGCSLDEDNNLILTREISLNGRNICRINSRIVNLTVFKEIGSLLINIYGQHDYQALSQVEKHIDILDSLGDTNYQKQLDNVRDIYKSWIIEQNKLKSLQLAIREKSIRLDFLKFQLTEIEEIAPIRDEDVNLKKELNILDNLEKISQNTDYAYEMLYGQKSIYDNLSAIISKLAEISHFDQVLMDIHKELEGLSYQIEETARVLKKYYNSLDCDLSAKENLYERDFLLSKIKRKYGYSSINEILNLKENILLEIGNLEKTEILFAETEKKAKVFEEQYYTQAKLLSQLRQKLALDFTEKLLQQLYDLSMMHTKFKVKFQEFSGGSQGIDKIEFLISPNPGQPLKPLAKIASGGEMSRIMLAFKVLLTDFDSSKTLIFDEIDTGIGGNILNQVAEKLSQVSAKTQVICVTHSPIIASMADNHILITKNIEKNTTLTNLSVLTEDQRIIELARMLGEDQKITRKHAFELRKKWTKK